MVQIIYRQGEIMKIAQEQLNQSTECIISLVINIIKLEPTYDVSTPFGTPSFFLQIKRRKKKGFLGGSVAKNPPTNSKDTGSIPGPGRPHVQWAAESACHTTEHTGAGELQPLSLVPPRVKPVHLETTLHERSPHSEKPSKAPTETTSTLKLSLCVSKTYGNATTPLESMTDIELYRENALHGGLMTLNCSLTTAVIIYQRQLESS